MSRPWKAGFCCLPQILASRYDIKGCEVSRWVEPAPEGSPVVLVLKDLNFQGKTIDLGEPRSRTACSSSLRGEVRPLSSALPSVHAVKNPDSGSNPGSTIYQLVDQGQLQMSLRICETGQA